MMIEEKQRTITPSSNSTAGFVWILRTESQEETTIPLKVLNARGCERRKFEEGAVQGTDA